MSTINEELTRRSFVKAAAASAAAGAVIASGSLSGMAVSAHAVEKDASNSETAASSSAPADISQTIDTQVVVCGGGISGLSAAVQAGQNDLSVVLLERMDTLGGNGVGVEGIFAANSSAQKELGITIDTGELIHHELAFAQYRPNGDLWNDFVNSSAATYDWLVSNGVTFNGTVNDYGGLYTTMHWFDGGVAGVGYVPAMTEAAQAAGVTIMLGERAQELVVANGAVTGVKAVDADGAWIQINAEAVILATGGFGGNRNLVEKLGFPMDHMALEGFDGHDGDGLTMALAAGARSAVDDACSLAGLHVEGMGDGKDNPTMTIVGAGTCVLVNQDAKRCINEDYMTENMMNACTPLKTVREMWLLGNEATINAALGDATDPWDYINAAIEDCPSQNAYSADSISEVAQLAGLDANALQETVDEYNEQCSAGSDACFGKSADLLISLADGPYYLFRLDPGVLVTIGAIDTNRNEQVLDENGNPIPGLYAVGVDGVRLYRETYPINVPSTCCGNNVNSGRIAANHIAGLR